MPLTDLDIVDREKLEIALNPRVRIEAPRPAPFGTGAGSRLRRFASERTLDERITLGVEGLRQAEANVLVTLATDCGLVAVAQPMAGPSSNHAVTAAGEPGALDRTLASVDAESALPEGLSDVVRDALEGARRRDHVLRCPGGPDLVLGGRTRIMGILNRTPDSFSDGGRFTALDRAIEAAESMVEAGADLIDIGGESTRPGAESVDAAEECDRVLPLVREIARRFDVPVSVDTTKSDVARRALDAGARILNDVSALTDDPTMAQVAAESGAPLILMHRQGVPRTMQDDPRYDDVIGDICRSLRQSLFAATRAGVSRESIVLDPGIGFGKTLEHNVEIFRALDELHSLGRPLLVGASRKRFLGALTGASADGRDAATGATVAACVHSGVSIVRVHDVESARQIARVTEALVTDARPGEDGVA